MRASSGAAEALLRANPYLYRDKNLAAPSAHVRVTIRNLSSGEYLRLDGLEDTDWLEELSWTEDQEQAAASLSLRVLRSFFRRHLIGLGAGGYSSNPMQFRDSTRVLELKGLRHVLVEVGYGPADHSSPEAWHRAFEGYVDDVTWGHAEQGISVAARDLSALLVDAFIEVERIYGSTAGVAVQTVMQSILDDNFTGYTAWAATTAYSVGNLRRPTTANRNGFHYRCVTAGTSAGGEPTWPVNLGSRVVDGTVTWEAWGLDPWLYVPSSPSWNIHEYVQSRTNVLDALRQLAIQIGWDVRYKWHAASGSFRLTLFDPRAGGGVDYTFNQWHYLSELGPMRSDLASVRNKVQVIFTDSSTKARTVYVASDATSQSSYGTRFMEIAEGATSNVDSVTEATKLGDNALLDLKNPLVTMDASLILWRWAELGDLYEFDLPGNADGLSWPDAGAVENVLVNGTPFSVLSITHSFGAGGKAETSFRLRQDQRTGFIQGWLEREVRPGTAPPMAMMADVNAFSTRAYRSGTQSISANTLTQVVFNAESHDLGGRFDVGTGKYTVAGVNPLFNIEAQLILESVSDKTIIEVAFYVTPAGGAAAELYRQRYSADGAGDAALLVGLANVPLGAGDVVEVRVKHNDSASRNVKSGSGSSWVQFKRLR